MDSNVIIVDNKHINFVKESVNPVNVDLYISVYTTLANDNLSSELDSKLSYLMSKINAIDIAYIPIGINTIFKEVLRKVIKDKGIDVNWDLDLRGLLSTYVLINEIEAHNNLVDLLKEIPRTEFDLFLIANKLDFEIVNLLEYINSYEIFADRLYNNNMEMLSYETANE